MSDPRQSVVICDDFAFHIGGSRISVTITKEMPIEFGVPGNHIRHRKARAMADINRDASSDPRDQTGAPDAPHGSAPEGALEARPAPKIKIKKPTQRACDELNAKGKLCCGHLKRWYDFPQDVEALIGAKAEVYRCEFCKALYRPGSSQAQRSYTVRY